MIGKFKRLLFLIVLILGIIFFILYRKVYTAKPDFTGELVFTIEQGESVQTVAEKLEKAHAVTSADLLRKYIAWKKLDRSITHGTIRIDHPMTVAEVANLLTEAKTREERTVTIIPGSNLRDLAVYFVKEGLAADEKEVYELLGKPADMYKPAYEIKKDDYLFQGKPEKVSLEGYLAPETFRVYTNATLAEIVDTFISHRAKQINELKEDIQKSGYTVFEILTVASLLEREVRSVADRKIVADIFWRRLKANWAFQADSSVHYIVGTPDSVFTSAKDRETDSLWNTYKYPGLPAGPISVPSLASIEAVLNPTSNEYWYFLTTLDTGEVKYGKTLEEHNWNVQKYLR